ncbi:hypothetical protein MVEN_00283400 [Mycena venus]|uniref:DUF6534 domain-containing protein n=1 Tax=Mycena venus TaxID=2733690 RepID=A0A8H7DCN9_9AGAR|nr:hypothetical protein MVEN_00283400 [Mycena venus]
MSSSTRLTGEDLRLCMAWLGPWLVGGCLDLFLQGILATQLVNYFTWYKDDKLSMRVIVAILGVMNVLKTIHSFAIVWIQSIVYFGDLNGAILLNYTTWWQSGNPLIVAICGFYVQMYFCYRLWVISKKWYIVALVTTVFVFAFLSMVVATYFITVPNIPQISNWFAAHLSSVFAGDILMSSTTAYFLIKSKHDVLPPDRLINSLVRLTFQTAAPAAICALFNLAFSQKNPGGSGIISTAFNLMLPKLYAISMMYTLNARRTIRATHSSHNGTSNEISGGRSRVTRRQGDVELGAIQVYTQTETTQQIDVSILFWLLAVRDMFDPTNKNKRGVESKGADDESEQFSNSK